MFVWLVNCDITLTITLTVIASRMPPKQEFPARARMDKPRDHNGLTDKRRIQIVILYDVVLLVLRLIQLLWLLLQRNVPEDGILLQA